MKRTKEKRGITLIALIITIIVLLILAGVTISMVVGDNGVLNQAQNAKTRTDEESAKEEIYLEVSGSYDETGEINLATLNENLKRKGGVSFTNAEEITEDTVFTDLTDESQIEKLPVTVKYKNVEVEIKGEYNSNKEMTKDKIFLTQVTVDNYGDYVNYDVDIDGNEDNNDWQIFYKDEENVYLIATDYITADKIPDNNKDYSDGIFINEKIAKYFKSIDSSMKFECYNKKVAYLLDSSDEVWGTFKNQYAEYILGGPTLEIFCNSWNERHDDNKIKCKVVNGSPEERYLGYEYAMEEGGNWTNYGEMPYMEDLYCKEDLSKASFMYLASGSGDYSNAYCVGCEHGENGEKIYFLCSYGSFIDEYDSEEGYRPLVCLNRDVCATKIGDVWNLSDG